MNEQEDSWSLVLSFDGLYPTMAEEHAFVHGFAFADIWRRMRDGKEAAIEVTTHTQNRTVIARAAASQGWDLEMKPSEVEGWDHTKLVKKRPERDNPHGLRIVG